jgi:hypothetical protein
MCLVDRALPETPLIPRWTPRRRLTPGTSTGGRKCSSLNMYENPRTEVHLHANTFFSQQEDDRLGGCATSKPRANRETKFAIVRVASSVVLCDVFEG